MNKILSSEPFLRLHSGQPEKKPFVLSLSKDEWSPKARVNHGQVLLNKIYRNWTLIIQKHRAADGNTSWSNPAFATPKWLGPLTSEQDTLKILDGNFVRVFEQVWDEQEFCSVEILWGLKIFGPCKDRAISPGAIDAKELA
jgi:hypothetical protein